MSTVRTWKEIQQQRALRHAEAAATLADVPTELLDLAEPAAAYRATMAEDSTSEAERVATRAALDAIRDETAARRQAARAAVMGDDPRYTAAPDEVVIGAMRDAGLDVEPETPSFEQLAAEDDADWQEQTGPPAHDDDTAGTEAHNRRADLETIRAELYESVERRDFDAAQELAHALEELQTHAGAVADLEELATLALVPLARELERLERTTKQRRQHHGTGAAHRAQRLEEQLEQTRRALELARKHNPTRRAIVEQFGQAEQ